MGIERVIQIVLMTGDKEIISQLEDKQIDIASDPACVEVAQPLSSSTITPPPPSAPSEFLVAQWLKLLPTICAAEQSDVPLTPPPPSAPSEFLCAQWSARKASDEQLPEIGPQDFGEAASGGIRNLEQLKNLMEEPSTSEFLMVHLEGAANDGSDTLPSRIRGVPLAPGEEIARVFLPNEGLVASVPRSGQALILTNQRLIAFRGVEGFRDTHMAFVNEIVQCSVRTGQRNWSAILQGLMIMVGGAFLYLIVGYWLAGQISGPNVPVLNIDVAPFIALLIILAGLFILASNYFTRPAGAVIFHGEGMEVAFPFRSSLDVQQVYDLVDQAQLPRRLARPETSENDPI